MGLPDTYLETKRVFKLKTPEDIPSDWIRLKARKNSTVTIRASKGVEEFKVSWQDAVLTSDPELDLIVIAEDGKEYPCKKEIFFDTYTCIPAVTTEDMIAGYKFIKTALTTLVKIPKDVSVEIHTLEGVLPVVEAPDYIAIGPKGELYANTAAFVEKNLTFVS